MQGKKPEKFDETPKKQPEEKKFMEPEMPPEEDRVKSHYECKGINL